MRTLILLSAFLLSFAWLPLAQASSPKSNSANARSKAAKIACAAGDFRKGVEILAVLYVDTNDATLIYNQGRCYEQNHQWASAIDRFREYLRKTPSISAQDAADTEKHIADCRAFQAEEERQTTPPPVVTSPPPPPLLPPPQPLVGAPPVVLPPPPPQEGVGSVLPTFGIVVGSIGLAGVATGVVLNLKANQAADSGSESSQQSYKTASLVCYGVGGAGLVTGIVLYLVGHKRARAGSGGIALAPLSTHGGAGLALEGEF